MDEHLEPLLRELIGDALRTERRRQSRTLAQVAAAAGISMQHLSDVERGRKDPSSEILAAIAGALALSVPQLLLRVTDELRVSDEAVVLDLTGAPGYRRGPAPRAGLTLLSAA